MAIAATQNDRQYGQLLTSKGVNRITKLRKQEDSTQGQVKKKNEPENSKTAYSSQQASSSILNLTTTGTSQKNKQGTAITNLQGCVENLDGWYACTALTL